MTILCYVVNLLPCAMWFQAVLDLLNLILQSLELVSTFNRNVKQESNYSTGTLYKGYFITCLSSCCSGVLPLTTIFPYKMFTHDKQTSKIHSYICPVGGMRLKNPQLGPLFFKCFQ